MAAYCPICQHEKRAEIDRELFAACYIPSTTPQDDAARTHSSDTIREIANKYHVKVEDLQVHALMHSSMVTLEGEEVGKSITQEVSRREADMLYNTAQEYWVTLSQLGGEIRSVIANRNGDGGIRTLTKPAVDLYLGTGAQLTKTIESIVDMNVKVNGEQDPSMNALVDIVKAIRGS